ncbi:MAG: hypothetical protein O2948_05390 [Proteobacteria bacterium]|nr:hypothetical protein [Pseudomonadota bacterium]MDA0927889.1 hypothetical protein [Pseudomonadota bacterium]
MDKLKWYWKLYSVLLLLAGFVQMFRKMLTDTGGPSSRYAAVVVAAVIVSVLIAKANQQAMGKVWMWQSLFVVLAIGICLMLGFGVYLGMGGIYMSSAFLGLGAALIAPAASEIFVYAYRSPQLWSWNSEEPDLIEDPESRS